MKKIIICFLGIMLGCGVWASSATWTGASGDGLWCNNGNWSAAYPSSASDMAAFNKDAVITLDTGKILDISYLKTTTGAITLNGTDGSALRLNKAVALYDSGLTLSSGSKLVLNVPVFATKRIDKWYDGTFLINNVLSNSVVSADGYGILFGTGLNVIGNGGAVLVPNSGISLGNGAPESVVAQMRLEGNARLEAKNLWLKVSTNPQSVEMTQSGADTSVIITNEVVMGERANSTAHINYFLQDGTFNTSTLDIGRNTFGWFEQQGGTATVGRLFCGTNNVAGTFALNGGVLKLASTPIHGSKGSFIISGGTLLATENITLPEWVSLEGEPTIGAVAGKKVSLLAQTPSSNVTLTVTGEGAVVSSTRKVLGPLVVDGVTFEVAAGAQLTKYENDHSPWKVKITNNGVLTLNSINSHISVPLDLNIEKGGKVLFPHSSVYARSVLVAHRLVFDGEEQPKGRYQGTDKGTYLDSAVGGSIVVPYVWTGLGDGETWEDVNNWEGGVLPPNDYTACVDLTRAAGKSISLADEKCLTFLGFMPQGAARKVVLTGAGALRFNVISSLNAAWFISQGAEVVCDVDVRRRKNSVADCLWASCMGGGSLVIKRGYPAMAKFDDTRIGIRPPFAFEGELHVSGPNVHIDIWDNVLPYKILTFHSHEGMGNGRLVIDEDAQPSLMRIFSASAGYHPTPVVQKGGVVKCVNDQGNLDGLYMVAHTGVDTLNFKYTLEGGTFIGDIHLGTYYSVLMQRSPGGCFEMSGGEVFANKIEAACNQNYIYLYGGTLNLGGDGFLYTRENVGNINQIIENTIPALRLGGVTIKTTASTKSTLGASFLGIGGATVFDLPYDFEFKPSTRVDGAASVIKRGEGTLTFGGTNAWTGTLTIEAGNVLLPSSCIWDNLGSVEIKSGCLQIYAKPQNPITVKELRLSQMSNLELGSDVSITVERLIIAGEERTGTVTFGAGSVVVNPHNLGAVWQGADGSSWDEATNWQSGEVPQGNVAVAFVNDGEHKVNIASAGISVTGIVYQTVATGGKLTLEGSGSFNFPNNAMIEVSAGNTLVLDVDVTLQGYLFKKGAGKLVVNKRVVSAESVAKITSDKYFLVCYEGTLDFFGEAEGIRLWNGGPNYTGSTPCLTIGEGAVCTNRVTVQPSWQMNGVSTVGDMVQDGGIVDMTYLLPNFNNSGLWSFGMVNNNGKGSYTLKNGTLILPSIQSVAEWGAFGSFYFTQKGGRLVYPYYRWGSFYAGVKEEFTLEDGVWELGNVLNSGPGSWTINLKGGTIKPLESHAIFPEGKSVNLLGQVTIDVPQQCCAVMANEVVGEGELVVAGLGTLRVTAPMSGVKKLEQTSGTLRLESSTAATNITVTTGELELDSLGACFMPDAEMCLSRCSTVKLDYEGDATITHLIIGGIEMTAGTYGVSVGKTCGDIFTGSGTLTVLKGMPKGTLLLLR